MQQKPILIGGGGHARSLLAMAPAPLRPVQYVDAHDSLPLQRCGNDEEFLTSPANAGLPVIIATMGGASASMDVRREIIAKYAGHPAVTIIAPTATVEADVLVGAGTAVFHRAFINTGCVLGNHCIVNTGAIIEHDVTMGDNVFIGPGAIVLGQVKIGQDCYIGAGVCLRNGISVAPGAVVGMGAVVTKDIKEKGVWAGNPAKRIR